MQQFCVKLCLSITIKKKFVYLLEDSHNCSEKESENTSVKLNEYAVPFLSNACGVQVGNAKND